MDDSVRSGNYLERSLQGRDALGYGGGMTSESKMFSTLLKFWRGKRGLSQLDLALKADVSSRHLSFLETGRSQPSREMVLRLAETLDLSLRESNVLLREAGFAAEFEEPTSEGLKDPAIERVLEMMLHQQEPYPLIVMDRWFNVLMMNQGAILLATEGLELQPEQVAPGALNAMEALFDPHTLRSRVLNWEKIAREILARLHREALHRPNDARLSELLERILAQPGVPSDWREPDLERGQAAVFPFSLRVGERDLHFVTTLTRFSTPRNVLSEELQIESYFPLDSETEQAWSELVR